MEGRKGRGNQLMMNEGRNDARTQTQLGLLPLTLSVAVSSVVYVLRTQYSVWLEVEVSFLAAAGSIVAAAAPAGIGFEGISSVGGSGRSWGFDWIQLAWSCLLFARTCRPDPQAHLYGVRILVP